MKTTLLSLVGLVGLTSAPAFADVGALKAEIFTSQSQLKIKGISARGFGGEISGDFNKNDQEGGKRNAVGGGGAFEFRLANALNLGAGLGYIDYNGDGSEPGYSDLIGKLYAAMDFINTDVAALYGKAGVSYHRLTLENFTDRNVRFEADGTDLVNWDAGVGARFKLNYATTLGIEYKYTQTFAKNDVDLQLQGAGLAYNGLRYKDIGIENNELLASLGFIF